jgi:hypothetical protein
MTDPTDDALTLDGNGIAGLLREVFGTEMTAVPRGCQSCGAVNPLAAHRAYQAAGTVLRCPACADIALTVVAAGDQLVVRMHGTWTFSVPRA